MLPNLDGLTKGQSRKGRGNNFMLPVASLALLFLAGQAYWLSHNTHMFAPFAMTRIDCDTCGKTGVVRDPDNAQIMKMCPVCFGVGYHNIRRFDEEDAVCAACGGMGRTDIGGAWRTCERCEGRGLYRLNEWRQIVEIEKAGLESPPTVTNAVDPTHEVPVQSESSSP